MAWVFSERTLLLGSMAWSRPPAALLALGSVWRGMLLIQPVFNLTFFVPIGLTALRIWLRKHHQRS